MYLSALLDDAEHAINRGDYDAASQHFQEFYRELDKAMEETVERSVKSPWTEWREDEICEAEKEYALLKARPRQLSSRLLPAQTQM